MTAFAYFREPEADQGIFYRDILEGEYRGFPFAKTRLYQLYYITPLEGKVLPAELSSQFTQLLLLQKAVDKYLLSMPSGVAGLQDAPPPPAPRRLHRKRQQEEQEQGSLLETFND
jgi:hypothetical protein